MKDKTILKVYRASAGSGKTYTLAVEYIAHLIGGRDWAEDMRRHRHILAITFTNKATAEMKERILEFLHTLSLGADNKLAEKVVETGHLPKEDLPRRAKAATAIFISTPLIRFSNDSSRRWRTSWGRVQVSAWISTTKRLHRKQ